MSRYSIENIAVYVINKHNQLEKNITNLRLQKILFLINHEFVKNGHTCFSDVPVNWHFGPAYPHIYYAYQAWGNNNIPKQYRLPSVFGITNTPCVQNIDKRDQMMIDALINKYSSYRTSDLIRLSQALFKEGI